MAKVHKEQTDLFDEDQTLDVESLSDREVRETSSFISNRVLSALLGGKQERELARRSLSLEMDGRKKMKMVETFIERYPHAKNFKKVQKLLRKNPHVHGAFFEKLSSSSDRWQSLLLYLLEDEAVELLEINIDILEDLWNFLENNWGRPEKLKILSSTVEHWRGNAHTFKVIAESITSQSDFFENYRGFPTAIEKARSLLVDCVDRYPEDLRRLKTLYDFLNLVRLTSTFETHIDEMDIEFLSNRKQYELSKKYYEENQSENLSLKLRFLYIAFHFPEYKELASDEAFFDQFKQQRYFLGSLKHMLYVFETVKKGKKETAQSLIRSQGFHYVKEPADFELAEPWVTLIDPPFHAEKDVYERPLNAYLKLRKEDETKAAEYLQVFKRASARYVDGGRLIGNLLRMFDLYQDNVEDLRICEDWSSAYAFGWKNDLEIARSYFSLFKKSPEAAQKYKRIIEDGPVGRLLALHEMYKEDVGSLYVCSNWCKKIDYDIYTKERTEAISIFIAMYHESPEAYEGAWRQFMEKMDELHGVTENKKLLQAVNACVSATHEGADFPALMERAHRVLNLVKKVRIAFSEPKLEALGKWLLEGERLDLLVKDSSDMDFINQVIGKNGHSAQDVLEGYEACLKAGTITSKEKGLVLEFLERFRVLSPALIGGYKRARTEGAQEVYFAQLNSIAGRMTGAGKLTDEERNSPYYGDLLQEVYKNNVGNWTNYENNQSCDDREQDLEGYRRKPRYEIDLFSQAEIKVKEGDRLDKAKTDELVQSVMEVSNELGARDYDSEKMKQSVGVKVDEYFQKVLPSGSNENELSTQLGIEEKLCVIILDAMYGERKLNDKDLKKLLISYEFAYFEDIRDYIQGTNDRVSRAPNKEYALLCELNTFFSDRIKEINKRIIRAGFKHPQVAKVIPIYFEQLSRSEVSRERRTKIEGMQPGKLGLNDSFIKQIAKTLKGKSGRDYTPEEVKKLIARYEKITQGLKENASSSSKQRTKAVYGQLRTQREKTRQLAEFITGVEIDLRAIHLGEINIAELLAAEQNISGGTYDPVQFEAYTVQRALNLFNEEKTFLASELAKFISEAPAQGTEGETSVVRTREVLNAYIAKTKETANARMVGGVCVSGDNPKKRGKTCLWNMENYFELVLEDPTTHRCMGVVLLHAFDEDGKTLTASFNPSSTYLYKVDEAALFKGLLETLKDFAQENGFSRICSSKNKAIRTNRTGGMFEKAMDEEVSKVAKTYRFSEEKIFSYSPDYKILDMDVLWEAHNAQGNATQ